MICKTLEFVVLSVCCTVGSYLQPSFPIKAALTGFHFLERQIHQSFKVILVTGLALFVEAFYRLPTLCFTLINALLQIWGYSRIPNQSNYPCSLNRLYTCHIVACVYCQGLSIALSGWLALKLRYFTIIEPFC